MTPLHRNERTRQALREVIPDINARAAAYDLDPFPPDPEVAEALRAHLVEVIPALAAAAAAGQLIALARAGHSLRGMGGAAGAPELSVFGEELEMAARDGDGRRAAALVARLPAWLEALTSGGAGGTGGAT